MAEDKLNESQEQAPEKVENPTEEMNEGDLEQVSGGVQLPGANNIAGIVIEKIPGNLVNGDSPKKNQVKDIPFSKTVKL